MANESSCKTCKYFDQSLCKRHPPQCATAIPQRNPFTQEVLPMIIAGWPQVSESDWCGEHLNGTKLEAKPSGSQFFLGELHG